MSPACMDTEQLCVDMPLNNSLQPHDLIVLSKNTVQP